MQKTFFSNAVLLVLLNLLVKPFYLFGIDAQIQNQVGAESYGLYFSLLNFSFLFSMVLDVGITNYNTKNIAESPHLVNRYFGNLIGIRLLLGLIYASITIGVALVLGYENFQMKLLSLLTINQFLAGMVLYFRSNFAGLHWFRLDAFFSVLDRFLLIGICAVLLYTSFTAKAFQIEWFVEAQTASYGIAALLGLFISLFKLSKPKVRVKKVLSLAILRKTAPFAMLTFLMMLYSRTDAVMLERLHPNGFYEAGIYAQGFRLLDAANIFALLIAGLLLPIFARKIKTQEPVASLLRTASLFMLSVAIVIALIASLYSELIISTIYTYQTQYGFSVFSTIIIGFIPMCATYVYGTLLTANGSLSALNKMAVFGLLINLLLNFLIIPKYGAFGAAIATLFTQGFTAIWQFILVHKHFQLNYTFVNAIKLLLLISLVLGVTTMLKNHTEINEFLALAGSLSVATISIFALKLVSIRELKALI